MAVELLLALTLGASLLGPYELGGEEERVSGILVGVLTEQFDKRCHATREPSWVNPHLQVGFVRLSEVDDPQALRPLLGKVVRIEGLPDPEHRGKQVVHTGECIPAQMRSDWVEGKAGMRVQRDPRPPFRWFSTEKVEAVDVLKLSVEGEEVVARFRQHIDTMLEDITIKAHYEGCYGKPGIAARESAFLRVPKGQPLVARFPPHLVRTDRPKGRQAHRISSVQILSRDPDVILDLDLPVPDHESVRCKR